MAYVTEVEVRSALLRFRRSRMTQKTASQILTEATQASASETFDIFLSHCLKDADQILGVKAYLEEQGQKVYVDWIVDPQLSRERVTAATADKLRQRMRASQSMIFATSDSSPSSKWMPWELGYFDGFRNGRVAVLPIVAAPNATFAGQEYLGLYPKVEALPLKEGGHAPFVMSRAGPRGYMSLGNFKTGSSVFTPYS